MDTRQIPPSRLRMTIVNQPRSSARVAPMPRKHVRAAGRLLAAAFDRDPVIGHFMPRSAKRRMVLPGFFRSTIEEALPLGHVYELVESSILLGAAVWFPPAVSGAANAAPWRARTALIPARLAYRHQLSRLLSGFERLGDHHPDQPHWYLAFVGVSPTRQSHGFGAHLLAPVLEQADAADQLCYLETPFPQTHAFYDRLGFQRVDELRVFDDAPPVVTFLRKPRPGAT